MKKTRRPSRFVNLLFLVSAVFCIVYYLLNGFIVRFGQSLLWIWPVLTVFLLMRWYFVRRMIRTGKRSWIPKKLLMIMHSAIAVMLALFIAVEGIICTAAFQKPPMNLDYIIVLGAKVNGTSPSGALRNRIQLASEYLHENPRTLVIASGGQGPDEGISEAECIRRGLIQRGISEDRIIMEDASTSTLENILFSLPLIPDHSAGIGIVTNNYHMYRALKIANAQADRAFYPVPVATSLLSLPHAMVREFAALVVGFLSGDFS